jgi:hypothetical protein
VKHIQRLGVGLGLGTIIGLALLGVMWFVQHFGFWLLAVVFALCFLAIFYALGWILIETEKERRTLAAAEKERRGR